MKQILIGGPARAGKDSFANTLQKILESNGKTVTQLAFANALKEDCAVEIWELYHLDSFSQITAEKDVFRNVLISSAQYNRDQTNCAHYANILRKKISLLTTDYVIVNDLRHNETEEDELSLRNDFPTKTVYIEPTWPLEINEAEKKSLPKVKNQADWIVKWPKCPISKPTPEQFASFINPFIISFVRYFSEVKLFLDIEV